MRQTASSRPRARMGRAVGMRLSTQVSVVGAAAIVLGVAAGVAFLAPGAEPVAVGSVPAASGPAFVPALLEDMAGDAVDEGFTHFAYGGCRLGGCMNVPDLAYAGRHAPDFDILSAGLTGETEDALIVTMTVARVSEDFDHLRSGPENRVAEYAVCWTPAEDAGERCAAHFVALDDGTPRHAAMLSIASEACNDWEECTYDLPSVVTPGEPGTIQITVPKRLATADGSPLGIAELRAETGWHSANSFVPLWHGAWSVRDGQEHTHDHVGLVEPANVADRLEAGPVEVALAPVASTGSGWEDGPGSAMGPVRVLTAQPGLLWGDGGPRDLPWMDLVGLSLEERGDETLLVRLEVAGVEALPKDGFHHIGFLGVKGGVLHEVGLIHDSDGKTFGYAGQCISFGCHEAHAEPVPFKVEPGSPGAFVLEIPRAILFDVTKGRELSAVWGATSYAEASLYVGDFGDPLSGGVHSASVADGWFGGAPYVFTRGPSEAEDGHGHEH